MATVCIDKISIAIPTIKMIYKRRITINKHPDIMFIMPPDIIIFIKLLITLVRNKYPDCGICKKDQYSISLGINKNCLESIIHLTQNIYYDPINFKSFLIFNTTNLSNDDILYVAEYISKITKNEVYLNMEGKYYPYFYRLLKKYHPQHWQSLWYKTDKIYYMCK